MKLKIHMVARIGVLLSLTWVFAQGPLWASEVGNAGSAQQWPRISEVVVSAHFSAHNGRVFKQTIYSDKMKALYILDARIPSDEGDAVERAYDYSGAFDCRLYAVDYGNGIRYPSLLTNVRNATRDWETDGRFLESELAPLADSNGSRVIVQRSRLRGMAIEIEVGNVVLDATRKAIMSFDAKFTFRNDPSATSDIAAPPS